MKNLRNNLDWWVKFIISLIACLVIDWAASQFLGTALWALIIEFFLTCLLLLIAIILADLASAPLTLRPKIGYTGPNS